MVENMRRNNDCSSSFYCRTRCIYRLDVDYGGAAMTDLQTRIREFLATAYSPDNPLTARDKLDQAVGLLREADEPHGRYWLLTWDGMVTVHGEPDGADDSIPARPIEFPE